ncbi:MAG: hypothetical protein M3Q34_01140 [bacterium]|nr:hypothetical protein [bacterium]
MKNLLITFALALFFSTQISAQAWRKNGQFTAGAKIALYQKWGRHMGYTPTQTVAIADSIYRDAERRQSWQTVTVLNTGVDAAGKVKTLDVITAECVYLGNIPAGPFGHPNGTTDQWLRKDCGNGGLNNLKKVPTTIPVNPVNPNPTGPTARPTKERLTWSKEDSADGSHIKIYAEQYLDGSYTGNNRTVIYQAPKQYDIYTYREVYIGRCGRYFTVATLIIRPAEGRVIYSFGN